MVPIPGILFVKIPGIGIGTIPIPIPVSVSVSVSVWWYRWNTRTDRHREINRHTSSQTGKLTDS